MLAMFTIPVKHEFTPGKMGLTANQKSSWVFPKHLAPMEAVGTFCFLVSNYNIQGLEQGQTTDVFSPPATWTAP